MKAPTHKRTVRLIPAIECTHLAAVPLIVQALNTWRRIAQKAVIWVPADRLDVLREVLKRAPLPIIPGLKSWHVLGRTDFTNPDKWVVLAAAAREACSIAGTRTIAWDHETGGEVLQCGRWGSENGIAITSRPGGRIAEIGLRSQRAGGREQAARPVNEAGRDRWAVAVPIGLWIA